MKKPWALLAGSSLALMLGNVVPPTASAANPVTIGSLPLAARLQTAPDSTVVKFGDRTLTLGELRAAHKARVAGIVRAGSFRVVARSTGPPPVIEPAADYGSTPADMQAFCRAAQASACLYVPPNQYIIAVNGVLLDLDALVDQGQCSSEGGSWQNYGAWGDSSLECGFSYPQSVNVHFTPGPTFHATSNQQCDGTVWGATVDPRGAIVIKYDQPGKADIIVGNDPSCVVTVTPS